MNCAIDEVTGDGVPCGRCYCKLEENVCPRHGNVAEVQEKFDRTGELTNEMVHYQHAWRS